jgi:molybdenum cofactor cytidylyltransferase
MGRLKQLLLLGDRTVLRHSIDTLREAGVSSIVVVCGADPQQYAPSLGNSGVRLVPNEAAGTEMADSVRLGLGQIDTAAFSGILVCLADHPLVQTETYRTLITLHYQSPGKIIVPAYEGRRGHPSLFPPLIINDIFSKTSLRDIVRQDPARVLVVDVPDEGVILDMDTEPDYQKTVELYQARSGVQGGEGFV